MIYSVVSGDVKKDGPCQVGRPDRHSTSSDSPPKVVAPQAWGDGSWLTTPTFIPIYEMSHLASGPRSVSKGRRLHTPGPIIRELRPERVAQGSQKLYLSEQADRRQKREYG